MTADDRLLNGSRGGRLDPRLQDVALLAIARRWLQTPDAAPPSVQRVLRCEYARARAVGRPYHPPSSKRLAQLLVRHLHLVLPDAETKLASLHGATT